MNREDFIKSNNEIDYIAYSSYLESSLSQKDEDLKKAIQSNINFQKHSSELEGENVLLKEEKEQLKEQLQTAVNDCKQRDEVIGEAIKFINETWWYEDDNEEDITYFKENYGTDKLLEILQKYKGDNNG